MARIAIDMDDVIADAFKGQAEWLEKTFSQSPDVPDGLKFFDVLSPEQGLQLELMLQSGEFFADLDPLAGAIETLRSLTQKHDVFIATAAMTYPNSCGPKFAWIEKYLPFFDPLNIVFCGDKSIISADYLIDDHSYNFDAFAGQGILFSASHNRHDQWPLRVNNWDEISKFEF